MKDLFIGATKRLDGIAMYAACLFFLIFAIAVQFFDVLQGSLSIPSSDAAMSSLLLAVVVFFVYIRLAYFSTYRMISMIINTILLLGSPVYFLFKLLI